ncbi:MAG TPA: NADPH-dependent F420 reductase [Mycobacterium sp.]|nr:NADPH-dependent F420 reductase [Mycobacterium sp.]
MPDPIDVRELTVAVLGGTGEQGQGLAYRLGDAGLPIVIGSRDPDRAGKSAAGLTAMLPDGRFEGASNGDASTRADLVIVAVPWNAHETTLRSLVDQLAGKIVVDCVNPLGFDERGPYRLDVSYGSAAEQAAAVLPRSTVVAAFHHVSASMLMDPQVTDLDMDVLVLGDDRAATDVVRDLAGLMPGTRGLYGGRLRNAGQVEAFTANLIAINRRYKTRSSIRITGV